uniref:Uncharacterized protein n=1 Tax=Heliothis virescens TaxID=7102 RepID=A0A2A4JBP8_HELVI
METTKESITKKGKRPKSATRYPKRMPTYVVAFAVQETHDDPPKNQQMPKKRSFETGTPSTRSISPCGSVNSAKTFTITPTEKLSHVLDVATISEVKIDIIDENQCGDVEKKSPQISSYFVVDNRMADEQPEIIFNASKHIKKSKENNKFTRKKPKKNKRVIKFKNVHFKYKNPKNNISRRLEKYYEKSKMNSPNAELIQKQICSNVLSKVVSRSRVLKKVLAKENLLDESGRISFSDGTSVNDFDDGSLSSSPSTTKKSFISHTSQNTLIRKDSSTSSRNDDFYSIKTANSVIQVSSDITPYKTDIINVAVAVAFNSKPNNNQNMLASNIQERFLCKENLTSEETFFAHNAILTSETPSEDESKYFNVNYDELSPMNLDEFAAINHNQKESVRGSPTAGNNNLIDIMGSENETFVIARTSSDFNKSSVNSDVTLTTNSDTTFRTEIDPNSHKKDDFTPKFVNLPANLLNRVIDLGFYPGMTPSTSSRANFENEINDVLIADKNTISFPLIPTNKVNSPVDLKNNITVLKKSYDVDKVVCPQKNISLPNDIAIKAKLKEAERAPRRSGADEVRNKYPTDLSEMWERLTLVLDLAVQRLENTLADKIVKDVKASLAMFNQREYKVPEQEIETKPSPIKYERPIPEMLHKEVFVIEEHLKHDTNTYVQCDLVQNQVIDQLMHHLSADGPQLLQTSTTSLKKLTKPQILKEYFGNLKAPSVDSAVVEIVAFNSKPNNNQNMLASNIQERFLCKENLTSEETFFAHNAILTSETPSEDESKYFNVNYDELSPMNLDEFAAINHNQKESVRGSPTAGNNNLIDIMGSENETFVIARTSSDFNKSSVNSDVTLTTNSDTTFRTEIDPNSHKKDDFTPKFVNLPANLLNRVIDLGFYPGMTPSTSSRANFENEINDVLIADKNTISFPLIPTNKVNSPVDLKNNITVLKKSYDVDKVVCPQKNISLPNDIAIKAKLKEAERAPRRSGADEVRNKYPTDLSEMWERLTLVLDLAVQRLENTLADKIVKDVKASLAMFNQREYKVPEQEIETKPSPIKYERPIPEMLHKEVFVIEEHLKHDTNTYVQCDLVQNQVIDQLMHHLSADGPQLLQTSTTSLKKLTKPQILKEYFGNLKAPSVDSAVVEIGKGDTVTVSTATAELHRDRGIGLKVLFSGPMTFIRENLFIITSVPTFFIVLLCLYGILVIIMKPL